MIVGTGKINDYGSGQLGIGGISANYIYASAALFCVINMPLGFRTTIGGANMTTLTGTTVDGNLLISNGAITDFGRLQLGGTTASFPALKRSSTTLAVRLADDSADAPISASSATFSNTVSILNSTTAQAFYLYNTYTDASNYERGVFDYTTTSNTLTIGSKALGTGIARAVAIVSATPPQVSASAAGAAISITASNATAGSASGSAAGGAVTITAGNAAAFSGSANGGSITLTSGLTNAAGTGGGIVITASCGTGSTDARSGAITISGSTASTTSGSPSGSNNGISITTGGGQATSNATGTGSASGTLDLLTGAGGASSGNTTGTGGNGSTLTITGGAGGNATGAGGTHLGGNGSALTLTSGPGGSATGASGTRTGGSSGAITIETGAIGTGATANGTAGAVIFKIGGTEKGRFTASGNLSATGTITNDDAASGYIGEYVSSLIASGSAVSLTTATAANVTSISLTAGDWDVSGNINYIATSATITETIGGISSTSATVPTGGSEVYSGLQCTTTTLKSGVTLQSNRFSLSGTTTVYLVAKTTFSAGTVTAFGKISARRVR
jgi:hypothetical protein